jgi:hypothetical protein
MLGGSDLAGRTLDQRGKVLAGENSDLNAPTLSLCVELRPVGEVSGRRVEEPKQTAHRGGRLPQTRRPSRRPDFAGPSSSHNRMTSPSTPAPQNACSSPPQLRLKRPFLEPAVDTSQKRGFGSSVESLYFSAICRTFRSGGTRIRTRDTMIFSHMQKPLGMRKTRIGMRIYVHGVPLDTSWSCPYCCATVDTAFVTSRGTGSRTRTSAPSRASTGYYRFPLSVRNVYIGARPQETCADLIVSIAILARLADRLMNSKQRCLRRAVSLLRSPARPRHLLNELGVDTVVLATFQTY